MNSKLFDRNTFASYISRATNKSRASILHEACLMLEDYIINDTPFHAPDYNRYTVYVDNNNGGKQRYIRIHVPSKDNGKYHIRDVEILIATFGEPDKVWNSVLDFHAECVIQVDGEETAKEEF